MGNTTVVNHNGCCSGFGGGCGLIFLVCLTVAAVGSIPVAGLIGFGAVILIGGGAGLAYVVKKGREAKAAGTTWPPPGSKWGPKSHLKSPEVLAAGARSFKFADYDGGFPFHPTPEKGGTLLLKPGGNWELHYGGDVGKQVTKSVVRMTNYDGGLLPHPRPEKDGTLTLTADFKWELHFRGSNSGKWIYGGMGRYQFGVTETGPSSCHVTISDPQDPTIRAAFDLPETAATVLQEELGVHRPDKWIHGGVHRYPFEVTETGPSSCHVTIHDAQDQTITAMFDLPETPAAVLENALPPKVKVPGTPALQAPAMSAQQVSAPPSQTPSVVEEIKMLAELRDSGILTEAEFQAKKTELLARM